MKRALLVTIGIIICTIIGTHNIQAAETEEMFGVILNEQGDGLLLNPDTLEPIDTYYNYICYSGWVPNAKPGMYVKTISVLDKYGECDRRYDIPDVRKMATASEIAAYNVAKNRGIYEMDATVTYIDHKADIFYFVTTDGNEWFDYGIENLHVNQRVRVVLYDNGTSNQHDDQIMQIQYWR